MHITEIQIERYGVWRNLTLPLPARGLSLFYGPNEVGKSTLMRFVRGVLYGFRPEPVDHSRQPVSAGGETWAGSLQISDDPYRFQIRREIFPGDLGARSETLPREPRGRLTLVEGWQRIEVQEPRGTEGTGIRSVLEQTTEPANSSENLPSTEPLSLTAPLTESSAPAENFATAAQNADARVPAEDSLRLVEPVETVLTRALRGIQEKLFERVFAVGLRELQELGTLSDAEVAQHIYGLSLGAEGERLLQVLQRSQQECDVVLQCSPEEGRLVDLYQELDEINHRLQQARRQRERHQELSSRRQAVLAEIGQLKSRQSGLEGQLRGHQFLERVWGPWQRLHDARAELELLPDTAEFPEHGLERMQKIDREIRQLKQSRQSARQQIRKLCREGRHKRLDPLVAQHADAMRAALAQKSWLIELRQHSLRAQQQAQRAEHEFTAALKALGPEWTVERLEQSALPVEARERLRGVGRSYQQALARRRRLHKLTRQRTAAWKKQAQALAQQRAALPPGAVPETIQRLQLEREVLQELVPLKLRYHELRQRRQSLERQHDRLVPRLQIPRWMSAVLGVFAVTGLLLGVWGLVTGFSVSMVAGAVYALLGLTCGGVTWGLKSQHAQDAAERQTELQDELQAIHHELTATRAAMRTLWDQLPAASQAAWNSLPDSAAVTGDSESPAPSGIPTRLKPASMTTSTTSAGTASSHPASAEIPTVTASTSDVPSTEATARDVTSDEANSAETTSDEANSADAALGEQPNVPGESAVVSRSPVLRALGRSLMLPRKLDSAAGGNGVSNLGGPHLPASLKPRIRMEPALVAETASAAKGTATVLSASGVATAAGVAAAAGSVAPQSHSQGAPLPSSALVPITSANSVTSADSRESEPAVECNSRVCDAGVCDAGVGSEPEAEQDRHRHAERSVREERISIRHAAHVERRTRVAPQDAADDVYDLDWQFPSPARWIHRCGKQISVRTRWGARLLREGLESWSRSCSQAWAQKGFQNWFQPVSRAGQLVARQVGQRVLASWRGVSMRVRWGWRQLCQQVGQHVVPFWSRGASAPLTIDAERHAVDDRTSCRNDHPPRQTGSDVLPSAALPQASQASQGSPVAADYARIAELARQTLELEQWLADDRRLQSLKQRQCAGRTRLETANREVATARQSWLDLLKQWNLPADNRLSQVLAHVQQQFTVTECRARCIEAKQQTELLETMVQQFEQRCLELGQLLTGAASPAGSPAEQPTTDKLFARWEQQLAAQSRLQQERTEISREIRKQRRELTGLDRLLSGWQLKGDALLSQAGVADRDEFTELARNVIRRAELEEVLAEAQREIEDTSADYSDLALVEEDLQKFDAAENRDCLEMLQLELDDVARDLAAAFEQRGALQKELELLEENNDATRLRFERERVVTEIQRASEQWFSLQTGRLVLAQLQSQFERMRQPAVLALAATHFSRLTLGKYRNLWTPLGRQELFVDDDTGKSWSVEQLSRGTREQLFLAIRLAMVQDLTRQGIELPLVLDDVLVNFDQRRAEAAVELLIDLGRQGHQILMFTCHQHLAQMFESRSHAPIWLPTRHEQAVTQDDDHLSQRLAG